MIRFYLIMFDLVTSCRPLFPIFKHQENQWENLLEKEGKREKWDQVGPSNET